MRVLKKGFCLTRVDVHPRGSKLRQRGAPRLARIVELTTSREGDQSGDNPLTMVG